MYFISMFLLIVVMSVYMYLLYYVLFKSRKNRYRMQRFYFAINCIYAQRKTMDVDLERLQLDYDKLNQEMSNSNNDMLDDLKSILYYYDTYEDLAFERIFGKGKQQEIVEFIQDICRFITEENEFMSLPSKENSLMQTLKDALKDNNVDLGINALKELAINIETTKKSLEKKEKINTLSVSASVIGAVLTFFFGIISLVQFLS